MKVLDDEDYVKGFMLEFLMRTNSESSLKTFINNVIYSTTANLVIQYYNSDEKSKFMKFT